MDYVYLQGAEDVQRAGNAMSSAADDMRRAANQFDETMQQHQRFMDDWLSRFEAALEKVAK